MTGKILLINEKLTLLNRLGRAPLCATADALVVSHNNQMKIGEQRLEVDGETLPICDEEAMCGLHVCYICFQAPVELVAEETLLLVENWVLPRQFEGRV